MMTIKAPTVTIRLDTTVDLGLVTRFVEAKKKEVKGKVTYDSLVSATKQAQQLLLDVIPQIEAVDGASPILIVNGDGEPVVQLGKAKAVTTLDVSEFIGAVLQREGYELATVAYLISVLAETGLIDLITIPAKRAKEAQFLSEYEEATTVENTGVRLVKPL